MLNLKGYRAEIIHFLNNNNLKNVKYEYYQDGLLIIENGKIKEVGEFQKISKKYNSNTNIKEFKNKLIMPGLIDTHVHYSQTDIIGSYGEQLLEWLRKYTFPTEIKFKNKELALETSEFFLNELLRNGTTTAMVFCTIHPESVEAFFEESIKKNMRMIAGKVHMNRNAPKELLDDIEESYHDAKKLIKKYHNKKRLSYAITPRFAPTSTENQLKILHNLYEENPDLYMQTHLSENLEEIKWVKSLFPNYRNYLEVYDRNKLVRNKSMFAHCIHLEDIEYEILERKNASISFCPSSNLFLGSGLFDLDKSKKYNISVGIGSDIGAGTSFSIIRNLGDAYKICQLNHQKLSAFDAFYLATLGGAKSLGLDNKIGNFEKNKEADFIIIDFESNSLMKRRYKTTKTLEEKLFLLMTLGGEENIHSTYIMGKKLYSKENN